MKNCFVLMPFGQPFDSLYSDILKPTMESIDFKVLRGDEIYTNRAVIDDIIENIVKADIIIADVSNKNPNVNYELGMAHALRKQVIIISQKMQHVPFDYKHIRTLVYNTQKSNWKKKLIDDTIKTVDTIIKGECENFMINSLEKFYQELAPKKLLGLQRVFNSRQSMNIYLEKLWEKPINEIDVMAFGLKSFRDFRTEDVIDNVKKGLKMRILTIDPSSDFLKQREKDEKLNEGTIKRTIIDLIKWCHQVNNETGLEAIKIKIYNALPLDFYWRQDDNLFVGPYLQGIDSQQTITFQFLKGSDSGEFYIKYFNRLWKDETFCSSTIFPTLNN